MAVQAGQLELNVMMPVIAFNMNFSIMIFGNALKILKEKCVDGITANADRCRHYAESSMGLATALNAFIGYAQAAEIANYAGGIVVGKMGAVAVTKNELLQAIKNGLR